MQSYNVATSKIVRNKEIKNWLSDLKFWYIFCHNVNKICFNSGKFSHRRHKPCWVHIAVETEITGVLEQEELQYLYELNAAQNISSSEALKRITHTIDSPNK
jgi:hypothetical protein